MRMFLAAALAGVLLAAAGADDKKDDKKVDELLKKIEMAAKGGKYDEMITLAKEAEPLAPDNPAIPFALGSAYTAKRDHAKAVEAFKKVVAEKMAPDSPVAHDRLGDAYLKNGQFNEAVASFKTSLAKIKDEGERKKADANQWRLGIAYYYAGKYEDGVKQFDKHKGPNPEDVENAVWHYLCSVKAGKKKEDARKDLIEVKDDDRVPMPQVWKMFKDDKFQPPMVLAAVKEYIDKKKPSEDAKKAAEFYAQLYIALYYDGEGNAEQCKKHLLQAVGEKKEDREKKMISHYMWDVAVAHLDHFDELNKKK